jgi:transposase-like protein
MSREKVKPPEYGTELKLAAVRRVLAGESVRAVADELGICRKRLYVWKDRYAELGEAGLVHRRGGRPRKDFPFRLPLEFTSLGKRNRVVIR